jgi:hypothetical protein
MEIDLTTPALLFPAISLLLLAYTNRFLSLAALVRSLHASYQEKPDEVVRGEIDNLRHRIFLIKDMQLFGVLSLLFCVICMFVLFAGWVVFGQWIFGASLILMMISLALSVMELRISVNALALHLKDMEKHQ